MRKTAKCFFAGAILVAVAASIMFSIVSLKMNQRYELGSGRYGLKENTAVTIYTDAGGSGKHLGDEILYTVGILYDPAKTEIEKKTLRQVIDFAPFTVRGVEEREIRIATNAKAHLLEYRLQLVQGKIDSVYSFSSIKVSYLDKKSGRKEFALDAPAPIFISARLPQDKQGFELQPMKGRAKEMSFSGHAPIFLAVGGLLVILGIVLTGKGFLRARKLRSSAMKKRMDLEPFFRLLQELEAEIVPQDPRRNVRMLYQAIRDLLDQKEKINWLYPALTPAATVSAKRSLEFMDKCALAYDERRAITERIAKELVSEFKQILESYHQGKGEA